MTFSSAATATVAENTAATTTVIDVNAAAAATGGAIVYTLGGTDAALFYVVYLFRQGFEFLYMGYASAMAWVLFVIIMAVTPCLSPSPQRPTGKLSAGHAASFGRAWPWKRHGPRSHGTG